MKSDKEFTHCKNCAKEFSLTRRKVHIPTFTFLTNYFTNYLLIYLFQHHCRSCGEIFCGQCSDNVMELASSSKAVRVCDTCFGKGLARFNTNTVVGAK